MEEEKELNVKMLGAELLVTANNTTKVLGEGLDMPEVSDVSDDLDEYQKIVKAGPLCTMVEEGDTVRLKVGNLNKPEANWVKKGQDTIQDGVKWVIDVNKLIEIGDTTYFILRESDIAYKVGE